MLGRYDEGSSEEAKRLEEKIREEKAEAEKATHEAELAGLQVGASIAREKTVEAKNLLPPYVASITVQVILLTDCETSPTSRISNLTGAGGEGSSQDGRVGQVRLLCRRLIGGH